MQSSTPKKKGGLYVCANTASILYVCSVYGPLTIANDLMVWNVTKDAITMREAVFPDRVTPPSTTESYKKAPRSGIAKMSKYIMDGAWKITNIELLEEKRIDPYAQPKA
jgi:hypothetical protein